GGVSRGPRDRAVTGVAEGRRDEPMKAVEEVQAVDAAPMHRREGARAVPDLVAQYRAAHAIGDARGDALEPRVAPRLAPADRRIEAIELSEQQGNVARIGLQIRVEG